MATLINYDCFYLAIFDDHYRVVRGVYETASEVLIDPEPLHSELDTLAKAKQTLRESNGVITTRRHADGHIVMCVLPDRANIDIDVFIAMMDDFLSSIEKDN